MQFIASMSSSPLKPPPKRRQTMTSDEQEQQEIQTFGNENIFMGGCNQEQEEYQTLGDINSNFNPFNSIPAGFRFCPKDEEIIVYYLQKKVDNKALPPNGIIDVNIYEHNPDHLTTIYPALGDNQWFFFTPRNRKHRNGKRPNRKTDDGYWKSTSGDKDVKFRDQLVGYKKTLVFSSKSSTSCKKNNWIMQEYRVNEPTRMKEGENDMRLDCVLCKIYKREPGEGKKGDKKQVKHKPTAAYPTTSFVPSVDNNDRVVGEKNSEFYGSQSTHPAQISQSTDGFLPADHALITDSLQQPILNRATRPVDVRPPPVQHLDNKYFQEDDLDDFMADYDTNLWEDCLLNDDLFAQLPNLVGQNSKLLV